MAAANETLEVEVAGVRFVSDDGAFAVVDALSVAGEGPDAAAGTHEVLVGPIGHLEPGDRVRATGEHQQHPKHGVRFRVRALESLDPDDEALLRTLQRIPGVGPASAESLLERFGDDLLARLDADPRDVLRRVRGLQGEKLTEAVEHWRSEAGPRAVRLLLERHGVDAATVGRVIRALGEEPDVAALQAAPYRLTERSGIGFPTADAIALALGEPSDGEPRRQAATLHALRLAEEDGHCHLPRPELVRRTVRLLGRDGVPQAVAATVERLVERGAVVERDERIATLELDEDEALLATLVAGLATDAPSLDVELPDDAPADLDPAPSDEQWAAVRSAVAHRLSILTGGPGTGKTQTMRALVASLRAAKRRTVLCAPTGKAARRLAETTGAEATTIHRLLGYVPGEGFAHDEDAPIADGVMLVVDEASMLSLDLAVALLRAVGPGSHVLLVGDVDQLAPVGPGRVLQDLLDSGEVPAVRLTRIFRQAERSLIVRAAHAINRGELPPTGTAGLPEDTIRDFFLIDRPHAETAVEEVRTLVTTRLPGHYDVPAVGGVQVLAPQRRGTAGVEALNRMLRDELNPGDGPAIGGPLHGLREGDRVMQTRNDHDAEVMNGELGMLVRVDGDAGEATVAMDDGRTIRLPTQRMDTWDLAYACTVHKAQGSSVPVVVVVVLAEHRHMLTRNLLYTAVTRAEKACVVVGDRGAIAGALRRVDGATRFTALPDRIREALAG
ncbi:AAA family ATPase [Patulibacter brassicae]|uniref:ATP-dependent RecD2 DNA helicase n=1 Tax=Patulibacter brassicae TaxID=1705717 RepID=A0ABU4VE46_9ACTN|nr:AAA family ATPase [Patulibacter brassicae]MDX8150071.1 AAA family ATPase [Patulibacter brassicae]